MGDIFSAGEIVEMGIVIEENGRDFYDEVKANIKDEKVIRVFEHLARQEEAHIEWLENLLSKVKTYEPQEAYPSEYFAYIKSITGTHVFAEKNKGREIAATISSERQGIDLSIGFEKDSILFYEEMKRFVSEKEGGIVDKLIEQEKEHLRELNEVREAL